MSRIYINLCGPYKYVKRAPSSLPFHTSIISYTESGTGHLVYYAIIFTQANLAMIQKYHVFIVVPGVLGNTIKSSWSLTLMNLLILPQISLTNCYLGYCIRFYFCFYSLCKLFFSFLSKNIYLGLLSLFMLALDHIAYQDSVLYPHSPRWWLCLPCSHISLACAASLCPTPSA